jgi:Fic family protein
MRAMYLWQAPGWPGLTWDANALTAVLAQARLAQGRMLGLAGGLGPADRAALELTGWAQEALATAQIDGEFLRTPPVRASAARRLGIADVAVAALDARTEATLDLLQMAVARWDRPLAVHDLLAWHAALFPGGRAGAGRGGAWRTRPDAAQIVMPCIGEPDLVLFEAPPAADVPAQMRALLEWFNVHSRVPQIDGLARAAVAHLWFEAIRPFDQGNGRIGRALAERALAQDLRSAQRLCSLSAEIAQDRSGYYARLQGATGHPRLDITVWLQWFVGRIQGACDAATGQMQGALARSRYWGLVNALHPGLGASQRKMLAHLLEAQPEGVAGETSTEKYVAVTGVSRATAYRELTQLAECGLMLRSGDGRGTRYALVMPG